MAFVLKLCGVAIQTAAFASAAALVIFGFLILFWRVEADQWARIWMRLARRLRPNNKWRPLEEVAGPPPYAGLFYILIGFWILLGPLPNFFGHQYRGLVLIFLWFVFCSGLVIFGFLSLFWRDKATKFVQIWTSLIRMQAPDADWSEMDRRMVPPRIVGLFFMLAGLWMIYLPLNHLLRR